MKHVVAACSLAFLICFVSRAAEEPNGIPVGSVAPALEGSAWASDDGKAPEMKGKVLLIDFWFEKCGPCVAGMPKVQEIAKKYAEKGLVVVGASIDPPDVVKAFRAKKGIAYAMLAETKTDPFQQEIFPYLFLIGKDGKVAWKGDMDVKVLSEKIEAELAR